MFPPKGSQSPDWDTKRTYLSHKLSIFYKSSSTEGANKSLCCQNWSNVDLNQRLCTVLKRHDFVVYGLPVFYVFVRDSQFEYEFFERPNNRRI